MPMNLLRWLSDRALPVTVTQMPDIDKLRILRAAGLVAAFLPGVQAPSPFARVLAITSQGRQELRRQGVGAARAKGS